MTCPTFGLMTLTKKEEKFRLPHCLLCRQQPSYHFLILAFQALRYSKSVVEHSTPIYHPWCSHQTLCVVKSGFPVASPLRPPQLYELAQRRVSLADWRCSRGNSYFLYVVIRVRMIHCNDRRITSWDDEHCPRGKDKARSVDLHVDCAFNDIEDLFTK